MIARYPDTALLFLRLAAGGMMLYGHGVPKLMKLLDGGEIQFADPIGVGVLPSFLLAIFAEVLCALFVMIGWFTRWAVVPLIITMLVAVVIVHAGDPFNKMELGALYLFAYITIFLSGPGWYSIDERYKSV